MPRATFSGVPGLVMEFAHAWLLWQGASLQYPNQTLSSSLSNMLVSTLVHWVDCNSLQQLQGLHVQNQHCVAALDNYFLTAHFQPFWHCCFQIKTWSVAFAFTGSWYTAAPKWLINPNAKRTAVKEYNEPANSREWKVTAAQGGDRLERGLN